MGRVGKVGTLVHKCSAERGCGRSPVGGELRPDAKLEQPICEQAVAVTLGGLQQLELFSLFAKHFHVEITVGFNPVLVDFDR